MRRSENQAKFQRRMREKTGWTMTSNIYLQLTDEFNVGCVRAVICSGQAAVLHRVAIMSKDGDWILRENEEACRHVLSVLERHGARYRFGAPLDIRWLAQGWSSHFEFSMDVLRVRTDFFSRPPRINAKELTALSEEQAGKHPAVVSLSQLVRMKQTDREKDYVVIGEVARRMTDPAECLRFSRSAEDLVLLADRHPDIVKELTRERPLLGIIKAGVERLEVALDAERRTLMHSNSRRLDRFEEASRQWRKRWPEIVSQITVLPLQEAHAVLVKEAEKFLPLQYL